MAGDTDTGQDSDRQGNAHGPVIQPSATAADSRCGAKLRIVSASNTDDERVSLLADLTRYRLQAVFGKQRVCHGESQIILRLSFNAHAIDDLIV